MRTPLGVLVLEAEILSEEIDELLVSAGDRADAALSQRVRDSLGLFMREIQRIEGLAEDYLLMIRPIKPHRSRFLLGEFLETVRTELRSKSHRAGYEIEIRCRDPESEVWLDPLQMLRVFHNLAGNSLDAIPEEIAPRIEIDAGTEGDRLVVRLRDNGPGLPPELVGGGRFRDIHHHQARRFRARSAPGPGDRARAPRDDRSPQPPGRRGGSSRPHPRERDRYRWLSESSSSDDDADTRASLAAIARREGWEVREAPAAAEALSMLRGEGAELVLCDLMMPGIDGIEMLRRLRATGEHVPFIMVTGHASVESAVEALRLGAFDYLSKPVRLAVLRAAFAKVRKARTPAEPEAGDGPRLEGESGGILQVRELIALAAPSRSTVLVTGETGTGKEIVAELIHRNSPRAKGPLVRVNCAALPENLIESELFGHEKGAFTGADRPRTGRFEYANGGTLFLDEVSEMSYTTQARLLRVLQVGEFERVGSSQTHKTDVRVIAATNRELRLLAQKKEFREDLYYRLHVIEIHIPPLRERREDIAILTRSIPVPARARGRPPDSADVGPGLAGLRRLLLAGQRPGTRACPRACLRPVPGRGDRDRAPAGRDPSRAAPDDPDFGGHPPGDRRAGDHPSDPQGSRRRQAGSRPDAGSLPQRALPPPWGPEGRGRADPRGRGLDGGEATGPGPATGAVGIGIACRQKPARASQPRNGPPPVRPHSGTDRSGTTTAKTHRRSAATSSRNFDFECPRIWHATC